MPYASFHKWYPKIAEQETGCVTILPGSPCNLPTEWMGDDNPDVIKELKGPVLNMASPQSRLAPEILDMVEKIVLAEQAYVDKLKRHYELFRK